MNHRFAVPQIAFSICTRVYALQADIPSISSSTKRCGIIQVEVRNWVKVAKEVRAARIQTILARQGNLQEKDVATNRNSHAGARAHRHRWAAERRAAGEPSAGEASICPEKCVCEVKHV
jgi:hypothetical protein